MIQVTQLDSVDRKVGRSFTFHNSGAEGQLRDGKGEMLEREGAQICSTYR